MSIPAISVIMGIYNCADTLPEAIECILKQTYTNWELIMCDDGSTDDTYDVAEQYRKAYPDKIVLLKNLQNMGLNTTLNNCLSAAKGEYIARMDGDDLCSPKRFEKEISFLENNSDYAIVSTDMEYFDECGVFGRSNSIEYPQKKDIIKGTPHCHAPCMVRKEAYDAVGGYSVDNKLLRVEDYDLWVKMYSKGYKGYNIAEPLYSMRDDRNAIKRRKYRYRVNEAYVKLKAIKLLKLPLWNAVYALKPLIVGLLPASIYMRMHKGRLN
ncbi:MAG: glycosyltransferase [Clostridia bacterium]|nr:glycosyltransferase [Clostridia bacterium]